MNKKIVIPFIISVLVIAGGYFLTTPQGSNKIVTDNNVMVKEDSMVEDGEAMMADDSQSNYVTYSPDYLEKYQGKTKVLFFHANWCPTCNAAEKEIKGNLSSIPENLVIIKTNYDTESKLKTKYGITYQHTFVLVDDQGNELDKWNGGAINEIIERI